MPRTAPRAARFWSVANLLQLLSTGYTKSFSAHQTLAQHREDSFAVTHSFALFRRCVVRAARYVGDLP
jgi:hypothetical protein